MNRHQKLGIIIAPFLAVGGFIAADYYMKGKEAKEILHKIVAQGECNIAQDACVIKGAGLTLKFSNPKNETVMISSHPLVSAAISVAGGENERPYAMMPDDKRTIWKIPTADYLAVGKGAGSSLRVVVSANGHVFFSEFITTAIQK